MSKSELRKKIRSARRVLSDDARRVKTQQLVRRIYRLAIFRRSRHIACYLAQDGEADVTPVIQRTWETSKRCYLPILAVAAVNEMRFAPYHRDSRLLPNWFGIPEPVVKSHQQRRGPQLDLVLVPLVAFDEAGTRLGMGGGFYDRTFAFRRHRRQWRKPYLLGVAFDLQYVEHLERAAWDVPLDGVVTESRFYSFRKASAN